MVDDIAMAVLGSQTEIARVGPSAQRYYLFLLRGWGGGGRGQECVDKDVEGIGASVCSLNEIQLAILPCG
jgi:hypothetical protein